MKHNKKIVCLLTALSASLLFAHGAVAAVSAEEASAEEAGKLKTTLTPLGGERAGNADGSIPAWTGGYTKVDPAYKDGGKRDDPFASDKSQLTITAQNMAQYADKLTPGIQAMLKKYPDIRPTAVPPHRKRCMTPPSPMPPVASWWRGRQVPCPKALPGVFRFRFRPTAWKPCGTTCCAGAVSRGTPVSTST